jgi:hypothetical protein
MAADPVRIRQAAIKDVFLRTVGMRVSLSDFQGLGSKATGKVLCLTTTV